MNYSKNSLSRDNDFSYFFYNCEILLQIYQNNKLMEFYLSNETIQRSKFKNIRVGDSINLELPLKFGQKISGHILQGHIDCTGKIAFIKKIDRSISIREIR